MLGDQMSYTPCQGQYCHSYQVTVSSETPEQLPIVSDCKYGDIVKSEATGRGKAKEYGVWEMSVTRKQGEIVLW